MESEWWYQVTHMTPELAGRVVTILDPDDGQLRPHVRDLALCR